MADAAIAASASGVDEPPSLPSFWKIDGPMIETGVLLAKVAVTKLVRGHYSASDLMKLVDRMVRDYKELGRVDTGATFAPVLDEDTIEILEGKLLRKTLFKAFSNTIYYRRLCHSLHIDNVTNRPLTSLPVTTKQNLRGREQEFVDVTAENAVMSFSSTGTTGFPATSVWMSRSEMDLIGASNAFFLLSQGHILPRDIVQFATTSRAGLTTWANIEACKRIGSSIVHTGLIDPGECLAYLSRTFGLRDKSPRVTVLFSYPSYLEMLLERASELGYSRNDFALRKIITAGEILTHGTSERLKNYFDAEVLEIYNISECIQVAGTVCSAGNLHFARDGKIEVLDPETYEEVSQNEIGILTLTPYSPPREITLLVRYVTGDTVRRLNGCDCELSSLPVVSKPLGKYSAELADYDLTYRELFELLEDVEGVARPLKVLFERNSAGQAIIHVMAKNGRDPSIGIVQRFVAHGLPLPQVIIHGNADSFPHYPIRGELIEQTFSRPISPLTVGAAVRQ